MYNYNYDSLNLDNILIKKKKIGTKILYNPKIVFTEFFASFFMFIICAGVLYIPLIWFKQPWIVKTYITFLILIGIGILNIYLDDVKLLKKNRSGFSLFIVKGYVLVVKMFLISIFLILLYWILFMCGVVKSDLLTSYTGNLFNIKKVVSTPVTEQTSTTESTSTNDYRHTENLHSSLLNFDSPVLQFCTGKYITRIDKLSNGKYRYASFDYPKTISDEPNTVLESGYFDSNSSAFKFPFKSFVYVVVLNEGRPVSLEVYRNGDRILQKYVQSVDYIYANGFESYSNSSFEETLNSQGIIINEIETVKEKGDKSLVIVNKSSENPALVIINKGTNQIEYIQRGTLSKEIDLAIGDKNKDINWIIKSVEVNGDICTERISAINMRLLTATNIHTASYPFVSENTWLNYSRDSFSNTSIDMNTALETFNYKKKDVNSDGYKDIIIYARSLDSDSKVFTREIVLYANEYGFSQ